MMATVPHVISGLGLRKFQADGFLLTRVYITVASVLLQAGRLKSNTVFMATCLHQKWNKATGIRRRIVWGNLTVLIIWLTVITVLYTH